MDPRGKYQISIRGVLNESQIFFGESLENVSDYLPSKVVILTDQNVLRLYGHLFPKHPIVVVEPGEDSKSLDTLHYVYESLIQFQVDRSFFLLGIGGGVICDLAGFAASTFMRGIPFGFVSTTLLSQVDASLGGKNGINVSGIKNLIGVFNQPRFVICDFKLLKTLPPEEIRSGFGELLKAALIQDPALFSDMESLGKEMFHLDSELLKNLVYRSVSVKKNIVELDEREAGMRRLLNYGHTFGHPIEMIHGITHGEAICHGMLIANHIAVEEGILDLPEALRITKVIDDLGLVGEKVLNKTEILREIRSDKKREQDQIHFVLLECIGRSRLWTCDMTQLDRYLRSYKGI